MAQKFQRLKERLQEITDIESAAAVLSWDQATYMPEKGAPARARQMATLSRIAHEKWIDPAMGALLDDLGPFEQELDYDSDEASLIRVTRRDYELATRIPPDRLAVFSQHASESYQSWTQARPANDFARLREGLEKTLDFSLEFSGYLGDTDHIIDPLIDLSDQGMTAASVSSVFADLRAELVPIVQAIAEQPVPDSGSLLQHFPEREQLRFGEQIIRDYGFDFDRGRQDKTHHPFMTKFSGGDIRITTRFNENDLRDGLFSTLHEAGHAMYEAGIDPQLEGTPLHSGTSAGVHESQSRLWENIVGRSLGFWKHYYPKLQATFPSQLGNVPLEKYYRAINIVQPSLIRTDADEVTYNLHVMIRFELEMQLLEGKLAVKDLPGAWNAAYQRDLGVTPADDRDGILQDVHWFAGLIGGAFQGYALGNILSGLFYEQALIAHPEIPAEIEAGLFDTLHKWMRQNIYRHGKKFSADEIVEQVSGGPLQVQPYVDYLRKKYGQIYDL